MKTAAPQDDDMPDDGIIPAPDEGDPADGALDDYPVDEELPHPGDLAEEPLHFAPPRSGMRRQMIDTAVGRMEAKQYEDETRALLELTDKLRAGPTDAYVEIRRTGPLDLPGTERGRIGKVRISDVRTKSLDDMISDRWGGGEYVVIARRVNGEPVEAGIVEVEIAGDPKPVSSAGVAWLQQRRGAEGGQGGQSDATSLVLMREMMQTVRDLQASRDSRAEKADTNSVTLAFQTQQQLFSEARQEQERRREEEKREREERIRREDAERKEAALERQREHEARMAREQRQWEADREAARARNEADREEAKTNRELLLKRLEDGAGGGLGLGVLKKLKEEFVGLLIDDVRAKSGADGGESSWQDVAKDVVREHGGEFIGRVLNIVETAKPGTASPRGLPPPAADASYEPETVTQPGDVSPQERQRLGMLLANERAARRVTGFLRMVHAELLAQGEPRAVWEDPQEEGGPTLADVYALMPGPFKAALAGGWQPFVQMLPPQSPAREEALAIVNLCKDPQRPMFTPWMNAFLLSGPWTWEAESDDEGEDDEAPEAAPARASGEAAEGSVPEGVPSAASEAGGEALT